MEGGGREGRREGEGEGGKEGEESPVGLKGGGCLGGGKEEDKREEGR